MSATRPHFTRRQWLQTNAAAAIGAATTRATEPQRPIPQVLYSNDTTNITSCVSPWRDPSDGVTDSHLRATIREAASADAHLLQPGLGWIPWWKSDLYSAKAHYHDFIGSFGPFKPNAYARYLLAGGDLVDALTDECVSRQILPFVSYRLNDGHHTRELAHALERGQPDQNMSRHYWENRDAYRIGTDPNEWDDAVFDWAIPAVRDHKTALITELCATHDFAGLELDFLRHWHRFSPDRTTADQRRQITTDFVRQIRQAVDQRSFHDQPRWLGVRVPAQLAIHPDQGIDLIALVKEARIDFINLSYSYFTLQDNAVEQVRALLPDIPVYVEMTHTTLTGKALSGSGTQPYLRTTDAQFYTTAHLAYQQGATGVSLFNFAYYREHSTPQIGPFHAPPFHILPHLKDRPFLARQPHWYFLTAGRKDPVLSQQQLPATLQHGQPHTFTLLAAPTSHHTRDGLLRLRSEETIPDRKITVLVNGTALTPAPFVAKPIDHPYDAWLGNADQHLCFTVPRTLITNGTQKITVHLTAGPRLKLHYLDLTLPSDSPT